MIDVAALARLKPRSRQKHSGMEKSRNPGEHKPGTVQARTAWPVGISPVHRKPWRGGGNGTATTSTTARSMEECVNGDGGIITRMNEHHILGNKTNKKTSDRKESVLSTVAKSPTAVKLRGSVDLGLSPKHEPLLRVPGISTLMLLRPSGVP